MIKFLIEKEFKQLFRNSFLPRLILLFPCMIMILMPWAMNLEIRNVALNIVDNDHTTTSRRLVEKIAASSYFRLTGLPDSYSEALRNVEAGNADLIMYWLPQMRLTVRKADSEVHIFQRLLMNMPCNCKKKCRKMSRLLSLQMGNCR